mmetsp:Transcript_50140/g.104628  ORF Transcript_50140/g.104628 Transcript_50140/m.104628 type:complete len:117 (-) Transcript_50140:14-364(-)
MKLEESLLVEFERDLSAVLKSRRMGGSEWIQSHGQFEGAQIHRTLGICDLSPTVETDCFDSLGPQLCCIDGEYDDDADGSFDHDERDMDPSRTAAAHAEVLTRHTRQGGAFFPISG